MLPMSRKRLGEILVQAGVLNESQLRTALTEQRRWGGPLGRILVDMKVISEDAMVQALSHQLNLPAINLDQRNIEPAVLDLVPGELAEQLSVIPFAVQGKFLDVAMSDPTNLVAVDTLRMKTRMNVRPYLSGPRMLERGLSRFYGRGVAPLEIGRSTGPAVALGADPELDLEAPPAGPSTPVTATARRAHQFEATREADQARVIAELRERVEHLEALVQRDEDVLRKLLSLLVQKGVATREEIVERLK
jgi:type IV pilus assembly protein PilB